MKNLATAHVYIAMSFRHEPITGFDFGNFNTMPLKVNKGGHQYGYRNGGCGAGRVCSD